MKPARMQTATITTNSTVLELRPIDEEHSGIVERKCNQKSFLEALNNSRHANKIFPRTTGSEQ
jgi:hypothetical protein